ncbi:MAG: hypothetical protein ACM3SO_20550, partial [Betaproteobacteria bacterium]
DPSLVEVFLKVVNDLGNAHPDMDSFLGAAGNSSPFFLARKHIEETIARARHDVGPLAQKE